MEIITKGHQLKRRKLLKITNSTETHQLMQYNTGTVTDIMPFDPDPKRIFGHGGLYFSDTQHITKWLGDDSTYIRPVTVADDEDIVVTQDGYRAHTITLGERMLLSDVQTWITLLTDYKINISFYDSNALRWAIVHYHKDIVNLLRGEDVFSRVNNKNLPVMSAMAFQSPNELFPDLF